MATTNQAANAKKEDTAKRIKIVGNAVVLTSKLPFATIQKMEKYNDKALALYAEEDGEVNEIFRIMTGTCASIGKYGIVFNEANKEGFARATVLLPEEVTDKRQFVKDNFGSAIFMLNNLEKAVEKACADLEKAYADLDKEIEEE